MRGLISFFIFLLPCLYTTAQQPLPAIGLWREHLPYNSAIDVTADNSGKIYCATPYSLFTVDNSSNVIERWSRVTGLHETGVSTIDYDPVNEKLFIAYTNSNIDIIYRNDIINIPDVKRDNIIGDKTIYAIYPLGKNYYLSTGLGIIVIDGERYEVKDSWFIGNGGSRIKVGGFTGDGTFFYAATAEGLKKASSTANLSDYTSWQLVSGSNGLPPGVCENVVTIQGKVVVQTNNSLYVQNGNNWTLLYTDGWVFQNSHTSANKILICERLNSVGRVIVLQPDGSVFRTIQAAPVSLPRKAILVNNDPWVADQFGGLSRHTATAYEVYKPNSPEATADGEMTVYNKTFYATAGSVNDSWNYQFNSNGIFQFKEGSWTNINRFVYPQLDTLMDFITIAADRRDETIWTGSYGGGLVHIKPGPQFEIFKQNFLQPAVGDPGSYRVSGLAFDSENNLWISNYGASLPLKLRKANGTWLSVAPPFFINENAMAQIIVDDYNYKWIVSPKGNGLICYDHGASLDNIGDDKWKMIRAGTGSGNLPSNDVLCIAKDKNSYIWVGTTDGIGVIQCPQDMFTARGCEAVLPVVQQGGASNYLFKGEEVRSIAVDGADRKWVATKTGVWLLNATGEKLIYHFTEANSPLLSSDVKKITIDGTTGEVYFATLKGICSFRSTATEANESTGGLVVFPNPVPPGYNGTIAIRGVTGNSIVKITELDGRLVYQARALGGQFVWDGRDYKGRRRSSGVYLVLISDENKTQKAAAKIIFLSK